MNLTFQKKKLTHTFNGIRIACIIVTTWTLGHPRAIINSSDMWEQSIKKTNISTDTTTYTTSYELMAIAWWAFNKLSSHESKTNNTKRRSPGNPPLGKTGGHRWPGIYYGLRIYMIYTFVRATSSSHIITKFGLNLQNMAAPSWILHLRSTNNTSI